MKSQKKLLVIIWGLVSGVLLIIGGFLSCFLFSTLVNYIIDSKVALLPGSEVSDAWIAPPLTPLLKIYYFNATNAEEYLAGGKLRVEARRLVPLSMRRNGSGRGSSGQKTTRWS